MEVNKIKLIKKILLGNYNLACEVIPEVHKQLIDIESCSDESFDPSGDKEFGRETKIRHIKSLILQLGTLTTIQAEYARFFNLLNMSEEELKQILTLKKGEVENLSSEIKKVVDDSKNNSQNNKSV